MRFRFHDRSPICIMAAEASRLMNSSIIVGHILSGIGTCYILRQVYRGFNTSCDDLRGTRRARIQNFSNVQPAVKQVDNDPKQYLSHVQAEVQHYNDLKQNLSYWRAAVRGLDIDLNRNFVHSQPAEESSGGGISQSLTHHPQALYARGVIKKEISKPPTHPQTETTEYSATKDVPPELRLARIHKFIFKNGEAAKSKTLGELAKDLRAFGIGGIWSELAEAKGNEVVKKD